MKVVGMTKRLIIVCAALLACGEIVVLAAPPMSATTKPALAIPDASSTEAAPAQPLTPQQTAFFETKIRPILIANCYECHSTEQHKAKGGLVLDSRDGWQKGGKHGPAIVPGHPEKSLLLKAVNHVDPDFEM